MPLTYTTADFVASTAMTAANLNAHFADVKAKFAAGIVNGDIATNAGISVSKLSANKEHMIVKLALHGPKQTTAPLWPVAGVMVDSVMIPDDGKGNWTITAGGLMCHDVGNDDAQVRFEWGRYVAGVWTVTSTPVASVAINSDDSGVNTAGQQTLTIASSTLTAGTHRQLAMMVTAQGTGTLTNVTDHMAATFLLSRTIST